MSNIFFCDDSNENNSFESSSLEMKFKGRTFTFFSSLGNQPEISGMNADNIEKERPLEIQSTLHQSKISAFSYTKRNDFDQNQEFNGTKNQSVVFNSDQQEFSIDSQKSHYAAVKRYEQANYQKEKQKFDRFGPNFEDLGRQYFIIKAVENKQKQQQQKNQAPKIATRNMLQYFWKVFKNYFTGKKQQLNSKNYEKMQKRRQIWEEMEDLKPSLASFTKLFKNNKMRSQFKEMFSSRFLMREIVSSSLKEDRKATYIRYIKVLLKGFLSKDLHFLN